MSNLNWYSVLKMRLRRTLFFKSFGSFSKSVVLYDFLFILSLVLIVFSIFLIWQSDFNEMIELSYNLQDLENAKSNFLNFDDSRIHELESSASSADSKLISLINGFTNLFALLIILFLVSNSFFGGLAWARLLGVKFKKKLFFKHVLINLSLLVLWGFVFFWLYRFSLVFPVGSVLFLALAALFLLCLTLFLKSFSDSSIKHIFFSLRYSYHLILPLFISGGIFIFFINMIFFFFAFIVINKLAYWSFTFLFIFLFSEWFKLYFVLVIKKKVKKHDTHE